MADSHSDPLRQNNPVEHSENGSNGSNDVTFNKDHGTVDHTDPSVGKPKQGISDQTVTNQRNKDQGTKTDSKSNEKKSQDKNEQGGLDGGTEVVKEKIRRLENAGQKVGHDQSDYAHDKDPKAPTETKSYAAAVSNPNHGSHGTQAPMSLPQNSTSVQVKINKIHYRFNYLKKNRHERSPHTLKIRRCLHYCEAGKLALQFRKNGDKSVF